MLQGGARRRFERLLQDSAAARTELARWQDHFATLADAVPPMQPSPQVWQGLGRRLGLQPPPAPPLPGWRRWLGGRVLGGVLGGALAGVVASTVLLQANPAWLDHEPVRDALPASYVGLLSDAAGQPALLLSARRQGRVLTAKLLLPLPVPAGQPGAVAHLWAFPKGGGTPFLVGRLPAQGTARLPLSDTAEQLFFKVDRLGVSFEPAAATPVAPGGPLVLAGPCVKLW